MFIILQNHYKKTIMPPWNFEKISGGGDRNFFLFIGMALFEKKIYMPRKELREVPYRYLNIGQKFMLQNRTN